MLEETPVATRPDTWALPIEIPRADFSAGLRRLSTPQVEFGRSDPAMMPGAKIDRMAAMGRWLRAQENSPDAAIDALLMRVKAAAANYEKAPKNSVQWPAAFGMYRKQIETLESDMENLVVRHLERAELLRNRASVTSEFSEPTRPTPKPIPAPAIPFDANSFVRKLAGEGINLRTDGIRVLTRGGRLLGCDEIDAIEENRAAIVAVLTEMKWTV